jgi:hypothetical protein
MIRSPSTNCEHCQTPIQRTPGNGRPKQFCSAKCQRNSRRSELRAKREPHKLECSSCGTAFEAQHKRKYCSVGCRLEFFNSRKRVASSRECRGCSKQFEGSNGYQKYCSPDCQQQAKRQRQEERNSSVGTLSLQCVGCGTLFKGHSEQQGYCGSACKRKAKRARRRQRDEAERAAVTG